MKMRHFLIIGIAAILMTSGCGKSDKVKVEIVPINDASVEGDEKEAIFVAESSDSEVDDSIDYTPVEVEVSEVDGDRLRSELTVLVGDIFGLTSTELMEKYPGAKLDYTMTNSYGDSYITMNVKNDDTEYKATILYATSPESYWSYCIFGTSVTDSILALPDDCTGSYILFEDHVSIMINNIDKQTWCEFNITEQAATSLGIQTGADYTLDMSAVDWKKQYSDFMTEYMKRQSDTTRDLSTFSLIYLNDDDIPEIFMEGDCEATGSALFYIGKNGLATITYLSRLGGSYIPRGNVLIHSQGHMGQYYDIVYCLDRGCLKMKNYGYYSDSNPEYDESTDSFICSDYYWNGRPVDKDEYDRLFEASYDASELQNLVDNPVIKGMTYQELQEELKE